MTIDERENNVLPSNIHSRLRIHRSIEDVDESISNLGIIGTDVDRVLSRDNSCNVAGAIVIARIPCDGVREANGYGDVRT